MPKNNAVTLATRILIEYEDQLPVVQMPADFATRLAAMIKAIEILGVTDVNNN